MLGLRSEREVRGSKIRDGEGQSWAGRMVWRNLGRQGKVLREADACCTASTAAPAAERKRWGEEREERKTDSVLQDRNSARNVPSETTQQCNPDLSKLMFLFFIMAVVTLTNLSELLQQGRTGLGISIVTFPLVLEQVTILRAIYEIMMKATEAAEFSTFI